MYFNAYEPGTPSRAMFAYNTINSTTQKISNMGYIWFAIDYESSFIFSGTGDAYGYEFWKASIVQQVTHSWGNWQNGMMTGFWEYFDKNGALEEIKRY